MKFKRIFLLCLISFFLPLIFTFWYTTKTRVLQTAYAASEARPELNILLDSSGSMAGLIGGKSKIQIAKEALNSVVDSLPEDTKVGLRVYGSQYAESQKNCQDTQVLFPVSTINKTEIKNQASALTPRGWTPIAYSLQQAYSDFGASDTQRYIVLISDGEETCGGDPCAAAKDLESKGIKLTINTIGFDVNDKARNQLTCIAQATGGNYYNATNIDELNKSLSEATAKVRESIAYTAEGQEIRGGGGFEQAAQIEADKNYISDILYGESLFFFLDIPKEKKLTSLSVTAKPPRNCSSTMQINLFKETREKFSYSTGDNKILGFPQPTVLTANLEGDGEIKKYLTAQDNKGIYLNLTASYNEYAPAECKKDIVKLTIISKTETRSLINPATSPGYYVSPPVGASTQQGGIRGLISLIFTAIILVIVIIAVVIILLKKRRKTQVPQTPPAQETPPATQSEESPPPTPSTPPTP